MSEQTTNSNGKTAYGLVSWDQEVGRANKQQGGGGKDLFLRLQPGHNVVRLLTKPHEYLIHRWKPNKNDAGYGERVMSSLFHGSDPLVDLGSKPQRRWLVGVIDRRTGAYKILDISVSVFKSVQELVRDEDWGDPSQYDVDIKVDKDAGPSGYYSVIPKAKKPLSPQDLEVREKVDLEDLKRRCTPPTPDQVKAQMEAIRNKKNAGSSTTNEQSSASEEDDDEFPAVD